MRYMGSKSRLKKEILPCIQSYINEDTKGYLEPFVGGANIIDDVVCSKKIGNDISDTLIALLNHVKNNGELPKEVDKELYDDVRANQNTDKYEKWFIGAVGYLASYNGRYFDGGYAKSSGNRNYYDEAKRNLLKQAVKLKDVNFISCNFLDLPKDKIKGYVIYCDPPYKNTKKYNNINFPHEAFYDWCRELSKNNIVLISEYNMPNDFECIWEKEHTVAIGKDIINKKAIEKLFIIK